MLAVYERRDKEKISRTDGKHAHTYIHTWLTQVIRASIERKNSYYEHKHNHYTRR